MPFLWPCDQPAKDRRHSKLCPQTSFVNSSKAIAHHRMIDLDDLERRPFERRVWITSNAQSHKKRLRRTSRPTLKGRELEQISADTSMHIVTTRTFSMFEDSPGDGEQTWTAPFRRLNANSEALSHDTNPRLPTAEVADHGKEVPLPKGSPLPSQEAGIKKQGRFSKRYSRESVGFGTATTVSAANANSNATATYTENMSSTAPTFPHLPSNPAPASVRPRPASPFPPPQIADDVLVMAGDGALRGVHRFLSTGAPSSEHLLWSHALDMLFPARSVRSRGSGSAVTRRSSASGSSV